MSSLLASFFVTCPEQAVLRSRNEVPVGNDALRLSPCSYSRTVLLCFFLGFVGVHRFYVGRMVSAVLMLLTFGGFGLCVLIDMLLLYRGCFTDGKGRPVLFRYN